MKYLFLAALLAITPAMARDRIVPQVLVGIHANQDGLCLDGSPATCEADILARESDVGATFAIDSQYYDFDVADDLPEAQWTVTQGHIPMVTWQHTINGNGCIFWSDVVAGVYDDMLATQAAKFAALGPMVLRFLPEMNKPHQACLYDVDPVADPVTAGEEFQALWQHVYSVVHPLAPEVQWDFSAGNDAFNSDGDAVTTWEDFYPGDGFVDWIGSQVYNGSETQRTAIQNAPNFLNFYNQVFAISKPLILSETGATCINVSCPGQKWLASMSANFASTFPAIKALMWFDVDANSDYRLQADDLVSLSNMMGKRYFQRRTLP